VARKAPATLAVLQPNLQIAFYYRLEAIRTRYLGEGLKATVERLDVKTLDTELREYVKPDALKRVAAFGIRGEVFFPVPALIKANPFLLGYYRLLYGLSQKEFYSKGPFGSLKKLEEEGVLRPRVEPRIPALCTSLSETGGILLAGLDRVSLDIVRELQLLTVGPQLRGGENTRIGQKAGSDFYTLLKKLTSPYITKETARTIILKNDSGRVIVVNFSSDPDVTVDVKLPDRMHPLLSVEIKGGTDASNIHNRLGEAEKSHLKAKNLGYAQFWTVLKVDVDPALARRESPTTTCFFNLERLKKPNTKDRKVFAEHLGPLLGIRI
jgi:hypothetical protein